MLVSLGISVLLHAAILAQPIMIVARRAMDDTPPVPVRLVNIPTEFLAPLKLPLEGQAREAQEAETTEGVTFVVEGSVATGYIDRLKARIFRAWEYPGDAIELGEEGKVGIYFVLDRDGNVVEIGVTKSSGSPRLDKAAVDAVRKAAPFGPLMETDGNKTLRVTGVFAYLLD